MATNILLFTAFIGHLICWVSDLLLAYAPGGKFQFECLKDNEKMSKVFEGMPLTRPLTSMLLGLFALMMSFCGYLGLFEWMKQFSIPCAVVMMTSEVFFFIPVAAHHVFCGTVEWFYIRLGRTEEARQVVLEFFKKTSATMYVCYLGLLVSSVTFFVAVVMGYTPIPRWGCICNVLPFYILFAVFKAPGAGNLAGAAMFLGLFLLI
ncbi:MAG: hypothetical protein NC393_00820 [Clostridium sp.]|nr:hypothetical protein [Clostridium sp.]MCM1170643.1 hypothetical protein [Clostridium sp.]MCM1209216.1 hypothetical protein [Ruminococcus sp.]